MKCTRPQVSRRNFLRTSIAAPVAYAMGSSSEAQTPAANPPGDTSKPLPFRKLGKNGTEVTMVSLGGMMNALSPDYLDIAWSMGIRYFDTADCYIKGQSEKIIAAWLAKYPERRKEIFLVSKDHPKQGVEQLPQMLDKRLAACGTSYLDLFFIHGIGPKEYGEGSVDWPKSDAFKKVCEQMKSSGKVKMVGFTCHDGKINEYLMAAAEGGFVDAIMLAYNPFFTKGDAFDKAVDACHQAGIGLIAMKTMRNHKNAPARLPEFDKIGLTTHQAVLHATWSDPRISAICSMIENVGQMEMNTTAAREYKTPLKTAHMGLLKDVALSSWRTMCPGCEPCNALAASTPLAFRNISRYVSYYEQEGNLEAKEYYQALPSNARSVGNVDLSALRDACEFKTDYPEIMRRAERYFA